MGWPQITFIAMCAASFAISASHHGKPKGNFSAWWSLTAIGIEVGLLYAGGFFGK